MVMPTLGPRTTSNAISHWGPLSLSTAFFYMLFVTMFSFQLFVCSCNLC